ncbi:MAG: aminotransferase class V-fold PLP-dependent enzyme [Acidimicrobiia bacterium]|nr:aminotransferase class V-fold PLP-dependent enzyme [Acidimicrobiia bacterium]
MLFPSVAGIPNKPSSGLRNGLSFTQQRITLPRGQSRWDIGVTSTSPRTADRAILIPMTEVYVDHAATTPPRPEVIRAMEPYRLQVYGNPSGQHGVARRAKNALEEAREQISHLLDVAPSTVVFTSGGTESDNLAILGRALSDDGRNGVVVSAVEHEAVLEAAELCRRLGYEVEVVPVDGDGQVDPERVAAVVSQDTAVVSVMAANNETGVVQPVSEIAHAVHEVDSGVTVHCDAVQWAVSRPLPVEGVDLLTICGHKLGGPRGVGVLVVPEGVPLAPTVVGGGQELGRRSGTPDVAAAVGMAAAMTAARDDRDRFASEVGDARKRFEATVLDARPEIEITGRDVDRLVQHSHLSVPGTSNETVVINLDRAGVSASVGSSCQSGAATPSHVLTAMGWPTERSRTALRFTFGWNTTTTAADYAAKTLVGLL